MPLKYLNEVIHSYNNPELSQFLFTAQKGKKEITIIDSIQQIIEKTFQNIKEPTYNLKSELEMSGTVIIPGIHGNLSGFLKILYRSGIIDNQGNWVDTKKTLVQQGNLIDIGEASWETFIYIRVLQEQANRANRDVIMLLGDHEQAVLDNSNVDLQNFYFTICENELTLYQEAMLEKTVSGKIPGSEVQNIIIKCDTEKKLLAYILEKDIQESKLEYVYAYNEGYKFLISNSGVSYEILREFISYKLEKDGKSNAFKEFLGNDKIEHQEYSTFIEDIEAEVINLEKLYKLMEENNYTVIDLEIWLNNLLINSFLNSRAFSVTKLASCQKVQLERFIRHQSHKDMKYFDIKPYELIQLVGRSITSYDFFRCTNNGNYSKQLGSIIYNDFGIFDIEEFKKTKKETQPIQVLGFNLINSGKIYEIILEDEIWSVREIFDLRKFQQSYMSINCVGQAIERYKELVKIFLYEIVNDDNKTVIQSMESVIKAALKHCKEDIILDSKKRKQIHKEDFDEVFVTDIHGNLSGFVKILYAAGLIDGNGNWIGGKRILIQLGDLIDRGPNSWETVVYSRVLQYQARLVGGNVVLILGNHEQAVLGNTWIEDNEAYFFTVKSYHIKRLRSLAQGEVPEEKKDIFEYIMNNLRSETITLKSLFVTDIINGDLQLCYKHSKYNLLVTHAGIEKAFLKEIVINMMLDIEGRTNNVEILQSQDKISSVQLYKIIEDNKFDISSWLNNRLREADFDKELTDVIFDNKISCTWTRSKVEKYKSKDIYYTMLNMKFYKYFQLVGHTIAYGQITGQNFLEGFMKMAGRNIYADVGIFMDTLAFTVLIGNKLSGALKVINTWEFEEITEFYSLDKKKANEPKEKLLEILQ